MNCRQWLSRYRDELKGIAMLWVVFFHTVNPAGGGWENIFGDIQKIGYGGVDIFLFLTGYGLYYALEKRTDIAAYWKRRLQRILPSYLPLILCWIAVMFPGYGLSTVQWIRSTVGNLFMVGFWFDISKNFNWYISAIMLFFLAAPLIHGLLSKSAKRGQTLFALLAVSFAVGLCCVGTPQYMAISRLPIFILGMAFAVDWQIKHKPWLWVGLGILSFMGGIFILLRCFSQYRELLNTYGMYWHPFVLITPPLCIALSYLFHKAEKARHFFAPLRLVGRASFEIYLVNIWMVELAYRYAAYGTWQWWLLCAGSVVPGLGYHFLVQAGTKALQKRMA